MQKDKIETLVIDLRGIAHYTRRGLLYTAEEKLDVTDRQARAIVSSASVQPWTAHQPLRRLNEPGWAVNSWDNYLCDCVDRRSDASAKNGKKGGRPRGLTNPSSGSAR